MFKEAKWVWYDGVSSKNSFGEFYGEFCAEKKAMAKISCDGDYTLFINGKYATSGQYGDFEHYKSVDTVDITEHLINGINRVGILVWHFGKDSQRYKKYTPGVICEITDGENIFFKTDENTLCRQSKAYLSGFTREISCQLGFSYAYDSTKEDAWALGNGESMKKAHPVDKKCDFVPRPNEKLRLDSPVYATKIGKNLYDLGKEYVGLLTFSLKANKEAKINIAYGECLENGHVKRIIGGRDFSVDYTAKGGENEYTNYMLRFACRYLEIDRVDEVEIEKIGLIPQYYPVTPKPTALSGIDGDIYKICVNTLRLSMMEHYVDCPWREQCLYAFDSRNQMLSGYYAFEGGNFAYARSNLLLMSKDRRQDGVLSICYPSGIDLTIPSFSLYYIIAIKEYIEHSGDTSIFNEVNYKLTEILNTFLENTKNGLVCSFEKGCHWNFFDWSPYADGYGDERTRGKESLGYTVLTVLALMAYDEILKLCTLPPVFQEKIKELRTLARDAFYDKDNKAFLTEGKATELLNALAVKAEVVTGDEAKSICQSLAKKEMISCSLSMKCFVYDALIKTDLDGYRDFILNDIRKAYKPMIEVGTVWETVVGATDFDNAGSLCHGWSSTPIYYYAKLIK